jgi:chemotaxis protein CheX
MSSIFEISSYHAETEQIVQGVFETMLKYQTEPATDSYVAAGDIVNSAIFFAGSWQGAVLLECSQAQAFFFTALLMRITKPTCMDDDVRDSMGEIINMIGGNLKSVLPHGVGLSMPSVLEGADYGYRVCGSNFKERLSFRGELGPFWITLVQAPD